MGAHGVVRITTIVPQFELPQNDKEDLFVVNGLQIPTEFVPFQPTPSNNSKASMPNYATPVFWSPNNAVENGKGELNYYQTDDKSTFVISVLAQSKSGKMGFVSKRYQVK
jgi:P pilus assembly chaperone PapD